MITSPRRTARRAACRAALACSWRCSARAALAAEIPRATAPPHRVRHPPRRAGRPTWAPIRRTPCWIPLPIRCTQSATRRTTLPASCRCSTPRRAMRSGSPAASATRPLCRSATGRSRSPWTRPPTRSTSSIPTTTPCRSLTARPATPSNTSGCGRKPPAVTCRGKPGRRGRGPGDRHRLRGELGQRSRNQGVRHRRADLQRAGHLGLPEGPRDHQDRQKPGRRSVDQRTDTVYAATIAPNGAEAVSVINGATCNATTTSGCRRKPPPVTVGTGSANYNVAFAIDQATGTLYVANWADNTLSMIDTATCDADGHLGLRPDPARGAGRPGSRWRRTQCRDSHPLCIERHRDTVSVLDAASCNATVNSGCGRSLPGCCAPVIHPGGSPWTRPPTPSTCPTETTAPCRCSTVPPATRPSPQAAANRRLPARRRHLGGRSAMIVRPGDPPAGVAGARSAGRRAPCVLGRGGTRWRLTHRDCWARGRSPG